MENFDYMALAVIVASALAGWGASQFWAWVKRVEEDGEDTWEDDVAAIARKVVGEINKNKPTE